MHISVQTKHLTARALSALELAPKGLLYMLQGDMDRLLSYLTQVPGLNVIYLWPDPVFLPAHLWLGLPLIWIIVYPLWPRPVFLLCLCLMFLYLAIWLLLTLAHILILFLPSDLIPCYPAVDLILVSLLYSCLLIRCYHVPPIVYKCAFELPK